MTIYFSEYSESTNITDARKVARRFLVDACTEYKRSFSFAIYSMHREMDRVEGYVFNIGSNILWSRRDGKSATYFLNKDGTLGKVFQYGSEDKRHSKFKKYIKGKQ